MTKNVKNVKSGGKTVALLATVLLFSLLLTCSVSAENVTTVLKGTPTIDGQLDEIYLESGKLELDNHGFYAWGDVTEFDMRATAYFLWDYDYLYCCTVVTDDDVLDVGADNYADPLPGDYWMAEAVEVWYDEGEGIWKSHIDAYGRCFYVEDTGRGAMATFSQEDVKYTVTQNTQGYSVEYAMPMAGLEVGHTLGTSLQVDDLVKADKSQGYASGSQAADIVMTLSADEAKVSVPETEAPATVAPETAAPSVDTPAPAAPATFDLGVIGFVGAAAALLSMRAAKKRR